MLVGQNLGPFVIDKELGAGAMGAVYRGRYTKTGQVVAIKVMAPGLDSAKSGAVERFEREAEILKQFHHPNIVRLFGVGKHKGTRYFAMEYIQGESLDRVMARRGRMTWEEVVTLGQQLCLALQHAHEQGVIHRDLKPSNLMILADGTLKLTDFGIAKDLDETALTSANCTVGTAAYMSPEQCKGERDLTPKSDLYSMGVLFYELITGRKPFQADNAMDMFMQHVQGTFARPSRLVLETPVWLDNLIAQLLEKKPEQRPRDASMVYNALGSIQEKVEAQQSAGVDVARGRAVDRPKGERKLDAEDKDAARLLFHGKVRQVRKKPTKRFYERVWFQAVGILALLSGLILALVLVFRPPSPEKLYRQAERLMKTGKPEDQDKARAGPIKTYLAHYRTVPGEQTAQIKRWADQIDAREYEEKLRKYLRNKQKGLPFEAQTSVEEAAFKAADAEESGDFERAVQVWRKIADDEGRHGWGLVAEGRLAALQTLAVKEDELKKVYTEIHDTRRDRKLEGLEQQAFLGVRAERFGDYFEAKRRFESLKKETATDPAQHFWYLFACKKLKDSEKNAQTQEAREKNLADKLAKAKAEQKTQPQDATAICLDILALYADNDKLAPQVKVAEALKKEIDAFQGGARP